MKKLIALLVLGLACSAYAADMDVVAPGNLTKKPQTVKTVPPVGHPKGKEGLVLVEIVISKEGKVIETKVKKSTDSALEPSALEAVKQWVFTPGETDSGPVATRVTIPFRYEHE